MLKMSHKKFNTGLKIFMPILLSLIVSYSNPSVWPYDYSAEIKKILKSKKTDLNIFKTESSQFYSSNGTLNFEETVVILNAIHAYRTESVQQRRKSILEFLSPEGILSTNADKASYSLIYDYKALQSIEQLVANSVYSRIGTEVDFELWFESLDYPLRGSHLKSVSSDNINIDYPDLLEQINDALLETSYYLENVAYSDIKNSLFKKYTFNNKVRNGITGFILGYILSLIFIRIKLFLILQKQFNRLKSFHFQNTIQKIP